MASIDKQYRARDRMENSLTNFKKTGADNMTKGACETRMDQLLKLWTEFEKSHDQLLEDMRWMLRMNTLKLMSSLASRKLIFKG